MMMTFMICHMVGVSSACTNPILYGFLNDNFVKEINLLCPVLAKLPLCKPKPAKDRKCPPEKMTLLPPPNTVHPLLPPPKTIQPLPQHPSTPCQNSQPQGADHCKGWDISFSHFLCTLSSSSLLSGKHLLKHQHKPWLEPKCLGWKSSLRSLPSRIEETLVDRYFQTWSHSPIIYPIHNIIC